MRAAGAAASRCACVIACLVRVVALTLLPVPVVGVVALALLPLPVVAQSAAEPASPVAGPATLPAPGPAQAAPNALLAAPLLDELLRSGLIGGQSEPMRAFSWSIVIRRPLRSPRRHREVFEGTPPGAPPGLSPMVRNELTPKGETRRTVRGVSVRGLMFLRPSERELDVRVLGLQMPLREGHRFRLEYIDEGGSLNEDCVVGGTVAASTVHPAIPGDARRIECSGRGDYHGIGLRVTASVVYLEVPGVFVGVEQAIESPIGRFRTGTDIVEFAMANP